MVKFNCELISRDADLAYESDVDVMVFVNNLQEKGIPAEVSFHAGTYVCNYQYFNCLKYVLGKKIKSLFIHVPASPEEVIRLNLNLPSFPAALIADAIFQVLSD